MSPRVPQALQEEEGGSMELDPLSFTFLDFGTTDKATNIILFIHGIKRYMYMYMYVYIINNIYIYIL